MVSLRWFISGKLSEYGGGKTEVGGAHLVDEGVNLKPVRVFMHTRSQTTGDALILDINDDGQSIFTYQPQLQGGKEKIWTTVDAVIRGGSVVTLDIDQVSGTLPGEDLTVQLDCEEI